MSEGNEGSTTAELEKVLDNEVTAEDVDEKLSELVGEDIEGFIDAKGRLMVDDFSLDDIEGFDEEDEVDDCDKCCEMPDCFEPYKTVEVETDDRLFVFIGVSDIDFTAEMFRVTGRIGAHMIPMANIIQVLVKDAD